MSRSGSLLSASLRLLGAALLATMAFGAPAFAAKTAPMPATAPLASELAPDGALVPGAMGSFDASGYTMTLGADGAPRFAPAANALAGDEGWDDRFGTPGTYNASVYALAAAPNGDLYVGGWFRSIPGIANANGLLRWDGSRWHEVGAGIRGAGEIVRAIAIRDNLVYVVGEFTNAGDIAAKGIAVWNGQNWATVGDGTGARRKNYGSFGEGYLYAATVAPNGDLYVGGYFNQIDDVVANAVARWDGQAWHVLGAGIFDQSDYEGSEPTDASVYALTFGGDGTLYAGGRFNHAGSAKANAVASWNGSNWSALGTGLTTEGDFEQNGDVRALAYGNGVLYAGGQFGKAGGVSAKNIAAWDGTSWSALGSGLTEQFESSPTVLGLLLDGATLYAGGEFDNAGGKSIKGVARWDGTTWSAVGEGANVLNNSSDVHVRAIALGADGLFAAGDIAQAGARYVYGIARWDGQAWDSLGYGVAKYGDSPAEVRSITIDDAGRVYIAGWINQVGGIPVSNVAMWDGAAWHDMGGGVKGGLVFISAILAVGDEVYVGGSFSQAGELATSNIARWTISTQTWSAVGTGTDGAVYALAYGDGLLFAGGGFGHAGGAEAKDVAIWDGAKWSGLGGDFEVFEIFSNGKEVGTYVNALTYANGRIYAGGHFQTIHEKGKSTQNLASYTVVHNLFSYGLDDGGWYLLGTPALPGVTNDGSSGFGTDVRALAVANGGLYVGGEFNRAGGTPARNLARYDLAANTWTAPGATGGPVDKEAVYGLTAYGNDLFVAGAFTTIGTAPARYVARYDSAKGEWSTLGSGLRWYNDKFTKGLSVAVGGDGVYVGGQFDYAGPHPAEGFARWAGAIGNPDVTPDAGGAKQFGDGTRAELPAGAVNKPAVLSYAALAGAPHPAPSGQAIVRGFDFDVRTLNGQALALAKPITLRIPYTDAQLAQLGIADATKLNVLAWNGQAWQPLLPCAGCGVDTATHTITLVTSAVGTFAIAGPSSKPAGQAYSVFLPMVRK